MSGRPALLLCALACAFGGEVARPTSVARPLGPDASLADAGARADAAPSSDAGDPLWVDERSIAPGMREVLRKDVDVAKAATVSVPTSAQVDTCARVAVRSPSNKVRARLVGPTGAIAEGLTLAERGPACVRKGEALTVELSSDEPARARVIVWVSP